MAILDQAEYSDNDDCLIVLENDGDADGNIENVVYNVVAESIEAFAKMPNFPKQIKGTADEWLHSRIRGTCRIRRSKGSATLVPGIDLRRPPFHIAVTGKLRFKSG
jgi:hypothetical protein